MILVNVQDALDRVFETLSHEFEGRVDVRTEYGDVPCIPCQPATLIHALVNILWEVERTLDVPGEVQVRTRCEGPFAVIEFESSGTAVSRFQFPRMFEKSEANGKIEDWDNFHVAAVYDFVKSQRGRFSVESGLNSGTTFTLKLPLQIPEETNATL